MGARERVAVEGEEDVQAANRHHEEVGARVKRTSRRVVPEGVLGIDDRRHEPPLRRKVVVRAVHDRHARQFPRRRRRR